MRIASECEPSPQWLVFENSSNLVNMPEVWQSVCSELHAHGYRAEWCRMYAFNVGARIERHRWFCLARHKDARDDLTAIVAPVDVQALRAKCAPGGWYPDEEPAFDCRMDMHDSREKKVRRTLLGNAVASEGSNVHAQKRITDCCPLPRYPFNSALPFSSWYTDFRAPQQRRRSVRGSGILLNNTCSTSEP